MVTRSERHDVFKALADPTRRTILSTLVPGELSVNTIARRFDMSRPAVSKHLRVLREAELVRETKAGKNRLYRLNAGPLKEVDDYLNNYREMWNSNLQNLKHYLENEEGGNENV
jgi:DNA-binding transcriptional ArsR family regulator